MLGFLRQPKLRSGHTGHFNALRAEARRDEEKSDVDFTWTYEQQQIRDSVLKLCARFDDAYWLEHDANHEFPEDFCRALADAGFVGVSAPR